MRAWLKRPILRYFKYGVMSSITIFFNHTDTYRRLLFEIIVRLSHKIHMPALSSKQEHWIRAASIISFYRTRLDTLSWIVDISWYFGLTARVDNSINLQSASAGLQPKLFSNLTENVENECSKALIDIVIKGTETQTCWCKHKYKGLFCAYLVKGLSV